MLRGTHIGEGCVIGTGSMIKDDLTAHSIAVSKIRNHLEVVKMKK